VLLIPATSLSCSIISYEYNGNFVWRASEYKTLLFQKVLENQEPFEISSSSKFQNETLLKLA